MSQVSRFGPACRGGPRCRVYGAANQPSRAAASLGASGREGRWCRLAPLARPSPLSASRSDGHVAGADGLARRGLGWPGPGRRRDLGAFGGWQAAGASRSIQRLRSAAKTCSRAYHAGDRRHSTRAHAVAAGLRSQISLGAAAATGHGAAVSHAHFRVVAQRY